MTGNGIDCAFDVAMVVPAAVIELDKANPTLGKAARDKAVRGEGSVSRLGAVEVKNMLRLLGHVDQIWNRSLACGKLHEPLWEPCKAPPKIHTHCKSK